MIDIDLPSSPYKGLMPFSEKDAPFFFGRESERKIISANLRTRRLTVLFGPSGVGKSSVINAGVVYDLRQLGKEQGRLVEELAPAVIRAAGGIQPPGLPFSDVVAELVGYRNPILVIV